MAGELRVSMLFQANAAQAKAEVAALRAETTRLGQSAAAAGQGAAAAAPLIGSVGDAARTTAADMIGAADGAAEWGSYVQMVRAQVQPLVGEAQALAAGMQQLALMEEMGALSAHEGALAHDMLSRKATDLMGRMEAAGVSIDGTTAAMRRQDSETQQLINRMTGVSSATEMTIADTLRHGQALDDLRARYNPLFAASRQYEVELHNIAEAERLGALSTKEAAQARDRAAMSLAPIPGQLGRVGAASGAATASLGQLGYQVNDIAMMMALGQSPFMLMVQQGPQVVQAFGLMKQSGVSLGAGLRSALMGLVSPMSLVTMGAIGLSAYAVQALLDTGEGATAANDAVDALATATDSYASAAKSALRPTDELKEMFGETAAEARKLLAEIAEIEGWKANKEVAKTGSAVLKDMGLNLAYDDFANQKTMLDQLGLDTWEQSSWDAVRGVQAAFRTLEDANLLGDKDKRLDAQFRAMSDLQKKWADASIMDGSRSAEEDRILGILNEQVLALMKQRAERERLSSGLADQNAGLQTPSGIDSDFKATSGRSKGGDTGGQWDGRRNAAEMIAAAREEAELARLKLTYGAQSAQVKAEEARQARAAVEAEIARLGIERQGWQANQLRQQAAEKAAQSIAQQAQLAQDSAAAMMAHHQQEAQMVALIAQYGADSLEVAYARASAERQVYEAQLAAQGIVGETADDLLRAWDAAEGIAAVNMAAGIGAAAGQAQLLASALGVSLAKAVAIMGLANKAPKVAAARVSFGGVGSAADGIIPGGSAGLTWGDNPGSHQSTFDGRWPDTAGAGAGASGGGGGGAAQKEASAVKRLVDEQRRQIEALRLLDPVQTEIAKNHEALAKATTAEREQVIELIKERMRLEEVRDRLQEIEQAGKNAFVGLVTGAQSFSEAVSNILMKLAEMAASDAWDLLWSGGSGGGGGLGSLISGWFGFDAQSNADGGHISGPGGPRDDAILSWLSNGEYVVNAAATQSALPFLEALNAGVPLDHLMHFIGGSMPAFADGGLVAPRAGSPNAWFGASSSSSAAASSATGGTAPQAGGEVAVRVYFDSRKSDWTAEVERISGNVATDKVVEGIGAFSNQMLPARMAEISDNPRVYG